MLIVVQMRVSWSVLSSNELGYQYSHAANWHIFSIKQVVSLTHVIHCNIATLSWRFHLLLLSKSLYDHALHNSWQSMPNIRIKWNPTELLFLLEIRENRFVNFTVEFSLVSINIIVALFGSFFLEC